MSTTTRSVSAVENTERQRDEILSMVRGSLALELRVVFALELDHDDSF
jgi:hypothetical protein